MSIRFRRGILEAVPIRVRADSCPSGYKEDSPVVFLCDGECSLHHGRCFQCSFTAAPPLAWRQRTAQLRPGSRRGFLLRWPRRPPIYTNVNLAPRHAPRAGGIFYFACFVASSGSSGCRWSAQSHWDLQRVAMNPLPIAVSTLSRGLLGSRQSPQSAAMACATLASSAPQRSASSMQSFHAK